MLSINPSLLAAIITLALTGGAVLVYSLIEKDPWLKIVLGIGVVLLIFFSGRLHGEHVSRGKASSSLYGSFVEGKTYQVVSRGSRVENNVQNLRNDSAVYHYFVLTADGGDLLFYKGLTDLPSHFVAGENGEAIALPEKTKQ